MCRKILIHNNKNNTNPSTKNPHRMMWVFIEGYTTLLLQNLQAWQSRLLLLRGG